MRTFIYIKIGSAIVGSVSLLAAILFNWLDKEAYSFLINILVGVFGSALLSYIGAFASYQVEKRESILAYLGALQKYRAHLSTYARHLVMVERTVDMLESDAQALKDCFYDMHYNAYLRIQHICVKRDTPKILNSSFNLVKNIQAELNGENGAYQTYMEENMNEAIEKIENLAREHHYLKKIKEKTNG